MYVCLNGCVYILMHRVACNGHLPAFKHIGLEKNLTHKEKNFYEGFQRVISKIPSEFYSY